MKILTENELKEVVGGKFITVEISNSTKKSIDEKSLPMIEFSEHVGWEEQEKIYSIYEEVIRDMSKQYKAQYKIEKVINGF